MSYCPDCLCEHCKAVKAQMQELQRLTDAWDEIEKAKLKPYRDPVNPWYPHRAYYGHCPQCGIKLEAVMNYCCPQTGCPTGLGPTTCCLTQTTTLCKS